MSIDKKTVEYVAHLARLELTAQEVDTYTQQLGNILEYATQLTGLNTDAIEPSARSFESSDVYREDIVAPFNNTQQFFTNGPDVEGTFYVVPKILEES